MKKTIVILSLLTSVSGIAQQNLSTEESPNKRIGFGFNVGLTKSYIQLNNSNPNIEYNNVNKFSFRMGPEMNINLSEGLKIHIPFSLVLHDNIINYNENNKDYTSRIYEMTTELSTEIKVNFLNKNKLSPYFIAGPNARYFLSKEPISPYVRKYDFALNFGVGFDNKVELFSFAPEIKYTYGVSKSYKNAPSDVSINPQLHTISLIFHFRD